MKKAVIVGKRKAELAEAPDPQPKENWVLIKVHAAPMCAEYKEFVAGKKNEFLGHEAAGEVVAVAQPGRLKVGDRVVAMPIYGCGKCRLCVAGDYIHCEHKPDFAQVHGTSEGNSTMAQYILKQDWLALPVPEGVSYEHASLACCGLGPSFGAMQSMGVGAFDTVLIAGAGPVGLGGVVNARFRGAKVIVVESVPYRVERARQMGVEHVLDPSDENILPRIKELTDGEGVSCSVDCAGSVQAQRLCMDATRCKGKFAFVGECAGRLEVVGSQDMIRTGISLIGTWHYNLNDFPAVMKIVQESPLIDLLISHVMPMSKVQEALELSASHECAKIILKPWE